MEDLKNIWQKGRQHISASKPADEMLKDAQKLARKNKMAHLGNALILCAVVVMLLLFFTYLAPFENRLSHAGVLLMVGGLVVRITIEIVSMIKLGKLDLTLEPKTSMDQALKFYNFRKLIHGPFTYIIIALYTIGFYMLTPEWSLYFSTWTMLLIDGSYVIIAIILIWQIRKGVIEEMNNYKKLAGIYNDMQESE
ncbi:hypothetical protein E1176_10590 [Fulvivirga sp. RKSG066]|uniref:hypothetical protein n=1 Tax=Fulvivirga aurantia TaxID=2529383 RepID=UPI0012BC0C0B|nr:hypothetical protein [Fulvivirga aurantia]MTI21465.1 hypothetical protein [Fulvivirga aurantia]